jgi:hypothetical protein
MRSPIAAIAVLLAPALMLGAPQDAVAADAPGLPLRKAGRWELKTVMDEGKGPREQVLTMCIDGDMERNTAAASEKGHRDACSKYEIKKAGGNTTVTSLCTLHGRKVESATEMTGDFETSFKVTIKSTTSGDHDGQPVTVKRTIVQDGRYLGESCGDLKAGEAMGPDGQKIMAQ